MAASAVVSSTSSTTSGSVSTGPVSASGAADHPELPAEDLELAGEGPRTVTEVADERLDGAAQLAYQAVEVVLDRVRALEHRGRGLLDLLDVRLGVRLRPVACLAGVLLGLLAGRAGVGAGLAHELVGLLAGAGLDVPALCSAASTMERICSAAPAAIEDVVLSAGWERFEVPRQRARSR